VAGRGGTGGATAGTGGGTAGTGGGAGGRGGTGGAAMCQMGEMCTTGQTCQTTCPATGANPMATFCTCTALPAGGMQYACVRVPCVRDAGSGDGATGFPTCPAGVRQGNVNCDTDTDTACVTACVNQMRAACVCVDPAGGGNNPEWVCADQAMACQ
jgi:hypothetical protein